MRRGEVFEYAIGDQLARIVIVSADPYNPRRACFAAIRHPSAVKPPPSVTALIEQPVRGTIDVSQLRPLVSEAVRASLGRVDPAVMAVLDRALRAYLDL